MEAAVAAEKREHRTNTAVAVDLQFESEMCSKIAKKEVGKKEARIATDADTNVFN